MASVPSFRLEWPSEHYEIDGKLYMLKEITS